MAEHIPIINILTFGLPGNVTRPMYLEYNNRRRELDRIWANPENHYRMLQEYTPTVEALLGISLFYRHVMGHMTGATSFYKFINKNRERGKECAIKVGNTILDGEQQRHLLSVVIAFGQLLDKYQLYPAFFEYSETIQFLRNCKELFNQKEYEEDDSI